MKTALVLSLLFFSQIPGVITFAQNNDPNPPTHVDEVTTTSQHSEADTSLGAAAKNAGAGGAPVGAVDPNTTFAQKQEHTVETRSATLPIALGVLALVILGTIAYSVNNRRKQGLDQNPNQNPNRRV